MPYQVPPVKVEAWDFNTNQRITDLRPVDPKFTRRLTDSGSFGLSLDLTDAASRDQTALLVDYGAMFNSTSPFKVIYTDPSSNQILYAGIAWQFNRSKSSNLFQISGRGLSSYWNVVPIAKSYTASIDPISLIDNACYDAMNAMNFYPMDVVELAGTVYPPNVIPNYVASRYPMVSQLISDMCAGVDPGTGTVDYWENSYWGSADGVPYHQLVLCAPRAGVDKANSSLWMDLSRAIDWTWPTDASRSVNQVIAFGRGTGSVTPVSKQLSSWPRGGLGQLPLMTGVYQFSQVRDQQLLDQRARGMLRTYQLPPSVPTVKFPIDYPPMPLGSYMPGDDVHVTCPKNEWFPYGVDEWWRVAAVDVTYPTSGGVPTQNITLNVRGSY
jgi:hypothetical protein